MNGCGHVVDVADKLDYEILVVTLTFGLCRFVFTHLNV
jgi:hypothetical protein